MIEVRGCALPGKLLELALIHRMAAAFQRLERADHPESPALGSAIAVGTTTSGAIVTNQARFSAINGDRATAQRDLFNAYCMLEVYRASRGDHDVPVLPNSA